jgi:gluconokinase
VLAEDISDVRFVFLSGTEEAVSRRLRGRRGHFMPPGLLSSQFAALEPPSDAIRVPIALPTDEQAESVLDAIKGEVPR